MSRRSRWLALLAGISLVFAMTMSVFAYGPQVPKPIRHLTVTWSFTSSPSSHDKIKPATSKTNKLGVARALVKLACEAGDRVITATTDGISGSAVVHVELGHHGHGCSIRRAGQDHRSILGLAERCTIIAAGCAMCTESTPTNASPCSSAEALPIAPRWEDRTED